MSERARCYLALQHQAVLRSVVERFPAALQAHVTGGAPAVEPVLVAEMVNIEGNQAIVDEGFRDKQPDWSYDEEYSGKFPAARFGDHRAPEPFEG